MHVIRRRGWELREQEATPEHLFFNRRAFLLTTGAAALVPALAYGQRIADLPDPTRDLYPLPRNENYALDRPITDEKINLSYNNFYEFGSSKNIAKPAQSLKLRPWTIKIDGIVEKPLEIGIDDLSAGCRWRSGSIATAASRPGRWRLRGAAFPSPSWCNWPDPWGRQNTCGWRRFTIVPLPRGQRQTWYPWPYAEGLTMAEATNELAFLVIGAYGKPVSKQQGAPLRLAVPWKYGFKSIKSIVRFSFTDQRPKSYWESLQGGEYGFWANVNPQVAHPRWSQATEELIGTSERRPTLLFNGYGEYVAHLYRGLENERLWA
jgi:methionine sulfoxide reductase catalytic subunit